MVLDFNFSLGIMDFVVIASLCVVLYSLRTLRQIEDALGVVFVAMSEMSKGNPVVFKVDDNGELHVSFPNLKEDDDDYDDD